LFSSIKKELSKGGDMLPLATQLEGKILNGGWKVKSLIPKEPNTTGGYFSVSYIVEGPDGNNAFLKALDYSKAMKEPDPARALQDLVEGFNFERDILNKCKNERLDRIVTAITDGTIYFDGPNGGPVQYIIFELADGDVRRQVEISQRFDTAWCLRSLHHISVGLHQLHTQGIAHQDLKPSNVLVFNHTSSKIGDFGRASYKGHKPPHEGIQVQGDYGYAPLDLLYGYFEPDWNKRKFGCDVYLMGSMVTFFFLGVGMTPLIIKRIPEDFCYWKWHGSFFDVMPYLINAYQDVLLELEEQLPEKLRSDLLNIVAQLCHPNPNKRGNRSGVDPYSMERYITWFDLLARRAEIYLIH
jgi:serine/threonine protein kinase